MHFSHFALPGVRAAGIVGLVLTFFNASAPVFAGQRVCVVPDGETSNECVPLSELTAWLRAPSQRDGRGALKEDTEVTLRPGRYRLDAPLVLDRDLVGRDGRRLVIRGSGVDRTVLTGARVFSMTPDDAGAPTSGRLKGQLSASGISIPESPTGRRFGKRSIPDVELFFKGRRMPIARWPDLGASVVEAVGGDSGRVSFRLKGRDASLYHQKKGVVASGYFAHNWADESMQVQPNTEHGFVFDRSGPSYGIRRGARVWLENAMVDVDRPGEWALDYTTGRIVFLPPATPTTPEDIELSSALVAVRIKGVSNVEISDLSIQAFREAGIVIEQAADIRLQDLEVANIGGDAIRATGERITVAGAWVHDTGGAGISLNGGDRKTLTPGGNAVLASRINDVGVLHRTYKPAIGLTGVGHRVEGNLLQRGPHIAILFHGNDHHIKANVIEDFVSDTDDAGAIYTGQDWTERGTLIEGNIIRRVGGADAYHGANAIYLDDQASGITVRGNLVDGVRRGVLIGGGRNNRIEGNIFANCGDGVYIDARGTEEIKKKGGLEANRRYIERMRQIPVTSDAYRSRYPELAKLDRDEPGRARDNVAVRNVFVACKTPLQVRPPAESAIKFDEARASAGASPTDLTQLRPDAISGVFDELWRVTPEFRRSPGVSK